MRFNTCAIFTYMYNMLFSNPGIPQIEEMSNSSTDIKDSFRACNNIKSRNNPGTRCNHPAVNGEYCLRHSKNPKPFRLHRTDEVTTVKRSDISAARHIQKFWRFWYALKKYRTQGPAKNSPEIATNQTELYTMENIGSIPPIYFISIWDERKNIWVFDIRSIVHTMTTGMQSTNPYTRDVYTERAQDIIYARINWLRYRKFQITHINTETLTEDQCWKQKVLDAFLKIEALGYYVSCDWFHCLTLEEHVVFYRKIYNLWEWRLGLTRSQKENIIGTRVLFKFSPSESPSKRKAWWSKTNLDIIDTLISNGVDKDSKKMGAMYALMGLATVSEELAESMPWLLD